MYDNISPLHLLKIDGTAEVGAYRHAKRRWLLNIRGICYL